MRKIGGRPTTPGEVRATLAKFHTMTPLEKADFILQALDVLEAAVGTGRGTMNKAAGMTGRINGLHATIAGLEARIANIEERDRLHASRVAPR